MNLLNGKLFGDISVAKTQMDKKIEEALNDYAKKVAQAKQTAHAYKAEAEYVASSTKRAALEARTSIAAAQEAFAATVRDNAKELKSQYNRALSEPPSPTFNALFKTYHDLSICPTRGQAQSLLDAAKGNLLALQAVQQLLTRTDAPLRLNFNGPDVFEEDLAKIEELAQNANNYTGPHEKHMTAFEVFNGQPITWSRADGTEYKDGRKFDPVLHPMLQATFDFNMNQVNDMSSRWSSDVSYTLADAISKDVRQEEEAETSLIQDALRREGAPESEIREWDLPPVPESETAIHDETVEKNAVALARELGAATSSAADVKGKLGRYIR